MNPAVHPFAAIDTSIGSRFEEIASAHAERMALSDGDCRLTYRELEKISRMTAARIRARTDGAWQVVAIFQPLTALHVSTVFAVLRSGCAYVSLDPTYPVARLRAMVKASGARLLLATPDLAGRAAELGADVLAVGFDAVGPEASQPDPFPATGPESFACLYFTSGSTGEPKPVVHTHRNILFDIRRQSRDMAVSPADRFDLLFSPSFSAFLSPVFGALLTGASVHAFDLKARSVESLRDWLRTESITLSTISVSTFRRLAATLPPGRNFPALRMLSVGAEPLVLNDLEIFRAKFSEAATLQNALATTETRTIAQLYYRVAEPPPSEVSVGLPVEGKILHLRDEQDRPVENGEVGEIVIESAYISPGSWTDLRDLPGGRLSSPRQTLHRTGDLARRRPDGCLVHLGRKDHQIKLRGHRIEAGEIESAFLKHPMIADAAVFLAREGSATEGRLVGLIVLRPGAVPPLADLRAFLAETLPDYLVPSAISPVPALPRTDTGKLDRGALGSLDQGRVFPQSDPDPAAGENDAGDDPLFAAWRRALAPAVIGPEEDFFASGGDSLAAVQLMVETERITGHRPAASILIQAPTFRAFRNRIAQASRAQRLPARVALQPGNGGTPIYLLPPWNITSVLFRDLARCPGGRHPVWGFEGQDGPDAGRAAASVEEIAELYLEALGQCQPEGNFAVGGFSMGGFVAWEIARRLAARGRQVARVFLLDCPRLYAARSAADRAWIASNTGVAGRTRNLARSLFRPEKLSRGALFRRAVGDKFQWWVRGRWRRREIDPYELEYHRNIAISQGYQISPCEGPVTLVRAEEQKDWKNLFLWDLGWSDYCRGVLEVVEIPATHLGLLHEPRVRLLSRALQSADLGQSSSAIGR